MAFINQTLTVNYQIALLYKHC